MFVRKKELDSGWWFHISFCWDSRFVGPAEHEVGVRGTKYFVCHFISTKGLLEILCDVI